VGTRLKGTLGVILLGRVAGHLSHEDAVGLVEAIRQRVDIWISSDLCDRALDLLERSAG
jgi:hypothetical protein